VRAAFERALALHREGNVAGAEESCEEILRRFPQHLGALNLLGVICLRSGRYKRAETLLRQAIDLNPKAAAAHSNLGDALRCLKRPKQALLQYNKAIALQADLAIAYHGRGLVLQDLKQFAPALASYDKAILLRSNFARAFFNRGNVLRLLKRPQAALESYDKAIALEPTLDKSYLNRGAVLTDMNRNDDALESFEKAVAIKPDSEIAHYNRGNALRDLDRFEEAIESYDRALALKQDYVPALWNQANCLLQIGNYERGLRQYEHRQSRTHLLKKRAYTQPVWTGVEEIAGKVLFIYPELYLGDMLQYCRYAPLAEARGAKVVLSAQNSLHQLLRSLSPTLEIIGEDAVPAGFDLHCPLMSLPYAFRTTLETIPGQVPYLHPEPERIEKWKAQIGDQGIKVGLCWQGSQKPYAVKLQRSFSPLHFRGIAKFPGVRLFCMQKPEGLDPLAGLPQHLKVESLGSDYDAGPQAFLDCAAVMQCLDLIVTTDTALAHLAGALGRPTWLVLKQVPDWRWMLERNDSPWYPTMRLFRQTERNDWKSAFNQVEAALAETFPQSG